VTVVRTLTPALRRAPRPSSRRTRERRKDLDAALRWNGSGNVVGFGLGQKRVNGKPCGSAEALLVFVVSKRPRRKVPTGEYIPKRFSAASVGTSFLTDLIEVGSIPLLQASAALVPGSNAAHFTMRAGTLTALVKTRGSVARPLLLSCCHSFAPPGVAGSQIECPPDLSAVTISNWVASVVQFEPLKPGGSLANRMDAALARPRPEFVPTISNNIPGLGRLTSTSPLVSGQLGPNGIRRFLGVGAATPLVRGELLAENTATLLADHLGRVYLFQDLVAYSPMPLTQPGDSGMPVLINTPQGLQLLGMHIGLGRVLGTTRGAAFFIPIGPVLERFAVDLIV
jgi:hypothetical protein